MVWIETGQEGNEVAIRVRDQGVGIAAKQKGIFKKFVRSDAAKAAGIKGTGLGLAMAERIVSAHGGRIRVASRPGAGKHVYDPAASRNGQCTVAEWRRIHDANSCCRRRARTGNGPRRRSE